MKKRESVDVNAIFLAAAIFGFVFGLGLAFFVSTRIGLTMTVLSLIVAGTFAPLFFGKGVFNACAKIYKMVLGWLPLQ